MAFTNFSTSILNYGPSLPTGIIPDGAMFHLTVGATGLYVYSFMQDIAPGTPGEQVGSGWKLLASTGALNADLLDGLDSTAFQLADADLTSISNMLLSDVGFAVRMNGSGTQWVSRAFAAGSNKITISNADGTGGNPIWDVVEANFTLNNLGGILGVTKGGTGNNVAVTGGIAYGTGSSIAYSPAGAAGQVLVSGGGGSPAWENQSALSVGFATNANNANSATTATTATNATNATNASNVPWTGVSGRPTALSQFTNDGVFITSAALSGYSLTSHNHSLNTLSNVAIAGVQVNDLLAWNGVNWVNTSTVAKASTLAQGGGNGTAMTFNWSGQVGQPSWLWGSNDGVTTNVWNPSNFSVASATNATLAANASSISSAVGNSYTWTASQGFNAGLISTGSITVAAGASGLSRVILQPGSNTVSGAIDFHSVIGREGYIGRSTSVQSADIGTIPYVAGTHAFSGNIVTSANGGYDGTITASGDVIAYSDARLKTNVQTIADPIETVQSLRGVTYKRIDSGKKSIGVIAQEVQAVLPELVSESADGTLGVAYGNMVGVLIEAIKEQQKQIEALREQVKQLVSSSSL
jgi:hypothetical protein